MMRLTFLLCLFCAPFLRADPLLPANAKRILVLGDSITYAGGYVAGLETWFLLHEPVPGRVWLNLGLPSENVSGVSEPGHAGGKFPRPCLHERLDRVLTATRPDLVIACYGMNDGGLLPFADAYFSAFQDGMKRLHARVTADGTPLILITSPVYDPQRGRAPAYASVVTRQAAWLVEQRTASGWRVLDLHGPMLAELNRRRAADPAFFFAKDAVHPDAAGHAFMAQVILAALGTPEATLPPASAPTDPLFDAVARRQAILRDAWLTQTRHLRPGITAGLPLPEAEEKAAAITREIDALLAAPRP